jgi:hypothetical protein
MGVATGGEPMIAIAVLVVLAMCIVAYSTLVVSGRISDAEERAERERRDG